MDTMRVSSMMRPKSILVATDLNDLDFLLPVAIDQARITGAMIRLLHVIPPGVSASLEIGAHRAAEAALAKVALQSREKKVACTHEIRRWYPVEEIKNCIREHGMERLIVGTSSRGKLGKLLIGSVAEELMRSLQIPVCTVGPHFTPGLRQHTHRIVFALSLRHHPEESLRFAVDLAAASRAELIVLHVTEPDRPDEGVEGGARSKLDELLGRIPQKEVMRSLRIRNGEPAEEIIAECTALRPDLLVLSAFPASPAMARFRAGVAYRVIAQIPCPAFTLRSGAKAKQNSTYREFSGAQIGSGIPG